MNMEILSYEDCFDIYDLYVSNKIHKISFQWKIRMTYYGFTYVKYVGSMMYLLFTRPLSYRKIPSP